MQVLASQIIGKPVLEGTLGGMVGRVKQPIIDPEAGKLIGLLVRTALLPPFFEEKILSLIDIVNIFPQGILIESIDDLQPKNELIRAKKILDQKIPVLGQRAETRNKTRLGKVSDLLIDSTTGFVSRFYIASFLKDLVLTSEMIYKITRRAVIFDDSVLESGGLIKQKRIGRIIRQGEIEEEGPRGRF